MWLTEGLEPLRRLVLNLLDNDPLYAAGWGVGESGSGQREPTQVADTGVGIPPEAAAHIFERFYRGDQARTRQDGGFGLGLSIVKWITEAHRGTVELSSQPGAGSTFTVLFAR